MITNVTPAMEIVQEEVFGPVVAAYSFKVRGLPVHIDAAVILHVETNFAGITLT